jgi:DNA invertase Pin-like site-specific DNA recombinase
MNTTILNNDRVAPNSGERTLRVVNAVQDSRKPRVAAYCRVSSDSADQLNSYASQMRYYTQIIGENPEWELADIYADEGETGLETSKRSDFLRLLRDCRAGLVDRVLCKSVSRFARNYTDCIETIRELKTLGVTVLFEKEGLDTAKMTSETMLSLQAMKAQRESLSLSGNLRRGSRMRMKNGTFVTPTPPYGYELRDKTLAVAPEKADVVKRIFADYLSGLGIEEIVKALNAENVPTHFDGAS